MALFNKAGLATGVSGVGFQMSRRLPPFKMSRQVTRTYLTKIDIKPPDDASLYPYIGLYPLLKVGCVDVLFELNIAIDLRYEQTWNLLELKIGDLESTMSLAPSGQLTLEQESLFRSDIIAGPSGLGICI
jgi:hypothetical protein